MMPIQPRDADLTITNGWILTMDPNGSIFYPGSVVVVEGRIAAVGLSDRVDANWRSRQHIDGHDHVVMPGLINVHGHASNSLIRGLGGDLSLHDWLSEICWPLMGRANDEDIYRGVLLSALEMLLNGITTFADMWRGVGPAAEAVAKSGLRAILAHNIKDMGDPLRGESELAAALDAYRKWNGYANGRVMVGLGPHSVYTCQPELLRACADEARSRGIHVQIHASETLSEVQECRASNRGKSPIELLGEVGLMGNRTVIAHAVWIDDVDLNKLQQSGVAVAHNIISNLKLGSGIAPVQRYLGSDICVGIGTDGPGSNDGLDVLRDLKTAVLVQRGSACSSSVFSASQALRMATLAGAKALGIESEVGSIEPGKRADLILIDMDKPHLTPHHYQDPISIESLLLLCASGSDVDFVLVDGELLLARHQLTHLDEERIKREAQLSSQRLLQIEGTPQ